MWRSKTQAIAINRETNYLYPSYMYTAYLFNTADEINSKHIKSLQLQIHFTLHQNCQSQTVQFYRLISLWSFLYWHSFHTTLPYWYKSTNISKNGVATTTHRFMNPSGYYKSQIWVFVTRVITFYIPLLRTRVLLSQIESHYLCTWQHANGGYCRFWVLFKLMIQSWSLLQIMGRAVKGEVMDLSTKANLVFLLISHTTTILSFFLNWIKALDNKHNVV